MGKLEKPCIIETVLAGHRKEMRRQRPINWNVYVTLRGPQNSGVATGSRRLDGEPKPTTVIEHAKQNRIQIQIHNQTNASASSHCAIQNWSLYNNEPNRKRRPPASRCATGHPPHRPSTCHEPCAHAEEGGPGCAMWRRRRRRRILELGESSQAGSGGPSNFRAFPSTDSSCSGIRAHKRHKQRQQLDAMLHRTRRMAFLVVVVVCLHHFYSLAALVSLQPPHLPEVGSTQQVRPSASLFANSWPLETWPPAIDAASRQPAPLESLMGRTMSRRASFTAATTAPARNATANQDQQHNQPPLSPATDYTDSHDDEFSDYSDTADTSMAKSPVNLAPQLVVNQSMAPPIADGPQATNLLVALFSAIDGQWSVPEVILVIVTSAILNLVTIVGNIMVLISFKMDRSLQTVSNYFLLSLAMADLLIGLISMPLYTLYLLLNRWPLGQLMCDIWLAIDYLNSNAAVLNMLVISFDRYFSVTRPLTYRAKRTTKHACLMILSAWILSLTIWTPAIFTYPYYKGRTVQGTDKCEIEFVKANTYLTFVTAILAFYIPAIIMIYLYWRIWLETKKRYRDLTTLFLVSGAGAAAPARPVRPLPAPTKQRPQRQPPQSQQPLALTLAPAVSATAYRQKVDAGQPQIESGQPPEPTQVASRQPAHDVEGPSGPQSQWSSLAKEIRPASPVKCRWSPQQHTIRRSSPQTPTLEGSADAPPAHYSPPPPTTTITTKASLNHRHQHQASWCSKFHEPQCCYCHCRSPLECLACLKCESLTTAFFNGQPQAKPAEEDGPLNEPTGPPTSRTDHQATSMPQPQPQHSSKQKHHRCRHQHCHQHALSQARTVRHRDHRHHCHRHRHRHHLHLHHNHHHHNNNHNRTTLPHCQHHQHRPACCAQHRHNHPTRQQLQQSSSRMLPLKDHQLPQQAGSMQCKVHPAILQTRCDATRRAYINQCHPMSTELAGINFGRGGSSWSDARVQSQASLHQQKPLVLAASELEAAANQLLPLSGPQSSENRGQKQSSPQHESTLTPDAEASNDDDDDERDCETRIVSAGDCFRFESEALMRQRPSSRRAGTRECCVAACLLAANARQCYPNTHKVNINNRCCYEAAPFDCRMCRRTSLTCRYLCGPTNSKSRTPLATTSSGCRKCQRRSQLQHSVSAHNVSPKRQQDESPLPILDLLGPKAASNLAHQTTHLELKQSAKQESASQPQSVSHGATKPNPKKFSQKLTFNEILVAEQTRVDSSAARDKQNEATRQEAIHEEVGRLSWWSLKRLRGCWFKQLLCPYKQMSALQDAEEAQASKFNHLLGDVDEGCRRRRPSCSRGCLRWCCWCKDSTTMARFSSKESLSQKNSRGSSDSDNNNNNNNNYNQLNSSSSKSSYHPTSHHPIQPKSERKAAKTLSTLLLVFIVTWLPYNILVLIKTLSGGEEQVPEKVWNFSYYLCYINSTINPLCYALCNAQFRRTYMRILKCKLSDEHNTKRRMGPLLSSSSNWNKQLQPSDTTSRSNSDNQQQHHELAHFRHSRQPKQSGGTRHLRHS